MALRLRCGECRMDKQNGEKRPQPLAFQALTSSDTSSNRVNQRSMRTIVASLCDRH
jgi:hypothetical protein